MEAQYEIALQLKVEMVGSVQKVLIDRIEGDKAYGRTKYDWPEVDPKVIVNDASMIQGEFVSVKITAAYTFELLGVPVK